MEGGIVGQNLLHPPNDPKCPPTPCIENSERHIFILIGSKKLQIISFGVQAAISFLGSSFSGPDEKVGGDKWEDKPYTGTGSAPAW